MDQACSHARHFVCRNARTHATATDRYAAIHLTATNRLSQGHDKIRIVVIRAQLVIPKVDHFIVSPAQHSSQILLRLKSSMIGGNANPV
jgi:hypothetical protein